MKSNWPLVESKVLASEGGYSNRKPQDDPGGATMKGVTQKVYDAYRANTEQPALSVQFITEEEINIIYYDQYAVPVKFDELPAGVDYAVFDYGFNSGPSQAIKDLQRCLNVPVDGALGQVTLAAASAASPAELINSLCDKRLGLMRQLKNWEANKNGWQSRVAQVRNDAMAMIATPVIAPPPEVEAAPTPKALPANVAQLKTKVGLGALISGSGVTGQTIMTAAAQVKPQIGDTLLGRLALVAFVLLMLVGGGLLGWDYYTKWQEKRQ
jgi:lysozyme family protein